MCVLSVVRTRVISSCRIQGCSSHVSRSSIGYLGPAIIDVSRCRVIDCVHVVLLSVIYYHYTVDCFGDSEGLENVYWLVLIYSSNLPSQHLTGVLVVHLRPLVVSLISIRHVDGR